MIMLLNWLLSIITFGTFSLATITMTNIDEYNYETVTDSGITLIDLFGETNAFDGTGYNLIENGDFSIDSNSDGLADGFSSYYSNNPSIGDYGQRVYASTTTNRTGIVYTDYQTVIGNNYYYYIEYGNTNKSDTTYTTNVFYTWETSIDIQGTSIDYDDSNDIISGTGTATQESIYLYLRFNDSTNNFTSSDYVEFKNIMLFDLTDIYGAGNEPTASQMNTWYATYQTALTTNQHEYTYTLNTIDLEDIVVLVSSAFMWYVAIKLFREVI